MHGEGLLQRAVEDGIAGGVGEVGEQDEIFFGQGARPVTIKECSAAASAASSTAAEAKSQRRWPVAGGRQSTNPKTAQLRSGRWRKRGDSMDDNDAGRTVAAAGTTAGTAGSDIAEIIAERPDSVSRLSR